MARHGVFHCKPPINKETFDEKGIAHRGRGRARVVRHVSGQCTELAARKRLGQREAQRRRGSPADERPGGGERDHPREIRWRGQRQCHHHRRAGHHGAHSPGREGPERPGHHPAHEERRHLQRSRRCQAERRADQGVQGWRPVRERSYRCKQGRRGPRPAQPVELKPFLLYVALLAAAAAANNAAAQDPSRYPERPIRLVVPQAAGSATDNVSRTLAPELSKQLGQNVVVDNRPGGALTIGIDIVAKSAPDGYTIGQGPVGALAITRHMVAKLPYDIERDLQPVALVTTGYMLLAVSPKTPFHSVKELIDYARKNPGKLSNASSSNGSPGHVSGELFKYMTGTDIVHVPYKGGAPAIADLIAGNVELMFESTNSIAPHVRAGRVRALAVTGLKRSISLPEVPTLVEAGVPGYEANAWSGVIAPAGLPRPILERLNKAINAAILVPETQQRFEQLGSEGGGGTPEEFAELIRRDSAKWADVVKRSGAKID